MPQPDLLLYAALFHDIGKQAGVTDHSAAGAALIPGIARRMGLSEATARDMEVLVREHLTLADFATTRDAEDPAVRRGTDGSPSGGSGDLFEMLRALTEADARAASPKAWTTWRAAIDRYPDRSRAARPLPAEPQVG